MTGYILPPGAVIVEKAGERKMRQAQARIRREEAERMAPIRAAAALLRDQDTRRRSIVDHLAAMTAEHDAIVAEIAAARARILALKGEALPEVKRKVAAARARLDALAGDVERARLIAEAQSVLAATEPTR